MIESAWPSLILLICAFCTIFVITTCVEMFINTKNYKIKNKNKSEIMVSNKSIVLKNVDKFAIGPNDNLNNLYLLNSKIDYTSKQLDNINKMFGNVRTYISISSNFYDEFSGCGELVSDYVEFYATVGHEIFSLPRSLEFLYLENCEFNNGCNIPKHLEYIILLNCKHIPKELFKNAKLIIINDSKDVGDDVVCKFDAVFGAGDEYNAIFVKKYKWFEKDLKFLINDDVFYDEVMSIFPEVIKKYLVENTGSD